MSLALWGRSVLGCQEVHLGLPKGSVEGSTKVPPRFSEVPARFHEGVISLVFWGRSLSFPKGSAEGPPITSLELSPSSAIVKVLVQNDMFVFWGSLQQWLSPPKRFFGVFPKLLCTFVSECPAVFGVNGCCFRKGSVEGSANYSLHLSPKWLLLHRKFFGGFRQLCFSFTSQSPPGVKVA